jgi:hypothetical protein
MLEPTARELTRDEPEAVDRSMLLLQYLIAAVAIVAALLLTGAT